MFTTIFILYFVKFFKKENEMILKFGKIFNRIKCLFTKHKFKRFYTNEETVYIICEKCDKNIKKNISNEVFLYDFFE